MAAREGLEFETAIESDCAPLAAPVLALLDAGVDVHCLRDLTRGGLASGAGRDRRRRRRSRSTSTRRAIPVREDVRGACEMLGLDPLYVANEGRFVAFVPAADADRALRDPARAIAVSAGAARIGDGQRERRPAWSRCRAASAPRASSTCCSGEQLPRIC